MTEMRLTNAFIKAPMAAVNMPQLAKNTIAILAGSALVINLLKK